MRLGVRNLLISVIVLALVSLAAVGASAREEDAALPTACEEEDAALSVSETIVDSTPGEPVTPSLTIDLIGVNSGQLTGAGDRLPTTRPAISAPKSTVAAGAALPLRFGTLGEDVLNITTKTGDAGTLQVIGVGETVNMHLGVRLAAPTISTGGGLTVLPWARATYQYDIPAEAPKLPALSFGGLGLGGGLNLFAGASVAASLSADWERREGTPGAVSGLGRLRIGF